MRENWEKYKHKFASKNQNNMHIIMSELILYPSIPKSSIFPSIPHSVEILGRFVFHPLDALCEKGVKNAYPKWGNRTQRRWRGRWKRQIFRHFSNSLLYFGLRDLIYSHRRLRSWQKNRFPPHNLYVRRNNRWKGLNDIEGEEDWKKRKLKGKKKIAMI